MSDRLLFIISQFHPTVGGAEIQAGRLARACAELGMPAEILTAAVPGAPRRELIEGVLVHRAIHLVRLPGLWGATHLLGTLLFLATRGRRYRLALCFQLQAFHNPAALLWGALTRTPVIVRGACTGAFGDLAALRSMRSGPLLLRILRHAGAFVALTEEMRAEMTAAGIAPGRISVIPNGVELPPEPPANGDGRRAEVVLFAGRLHPQKGVATLLEAFAALAPSGRKPTTLRLFGGGPEEPALRRRVADLGLEGRVEFAGWTSRLAGELGRASMAVLPTLGEGMSNVLLEAMAAGCPVVTTDIPANREVVTDGESGLLVPPGDPAALAAAMRKLLDDPDLAAHLASGARARVAARFSLHAVASRYLELFAGLDRAATSAPTTSR